MARTLRDEGDTSNTYRCETDDEWLGDGTAFLEDHQGRVIFGPWGRRVEQPEHHKHHNQHAAAAMRLEMPAHEYTAERLGGQRWCWYRNNSDGSRGHWVSGSEYSPCPETRLCIECRRAYQRELTRKRRYNKHSLQHAAAAKRLAIEPHEYTAKMLAGQRWCWYRSNPDGTHGHWVGDREYSTCPRTRLCYECRRVYLRDLRRRRSQASNPLEGAPPRPAPRSPRGKHLI